LLRVSRAMKRRPIFRVSLSWEPCSVSRKNPRPNVAAVLQLQEVSAVAPPRGPGHQTFEDPFLREVPLTRRHKIAHVFSSRMLRFPTIAGREGIDVAWPT